MTEQSTRQNNIVTKDILGVNVTFGHTYSSVISLIRDKYLKDNKNHMLVTANPEMIVSAQTDSEFRTIINNADLTVPDGIGLSMAYTYLTSISKKRSNTLSIVLNILVGIKTGVGAILAPHTYPQRITGVQLTTDILKMADEGRHTVFVLGGRPRSILGKGLDTSKDLATEFADLIHKKYPNVQIVGSTSSFSSLLSDDTATVDFISSCMKKRNISRLDVMLVAYNFNAQEKCISRLIKKLPISLSMGVGGTFDYMVGTMVYSPEIVRNMGMEWLFKLLKQPWRFKRVFNAFPRFPWLVFKNSL